jgi:predicted lipoprotein with Yx(FWY)xxD motif
MNPIGRSPVDLPPTDTTGDLTMTHGRTVRTAGAALALILALAACSKGTAAPAGGGGGDIAAGVQVATADGGSLGTILVDDRGYTLYLFEQDTGSSSTCTGACAGTWPALATGGAPSAGAGVDAALLGTTTRDDGSTQVTYAGHPLYLYAGDAAAGETNGEDVGGVWYAVTQTGTAAEPGAKAAGDTGDTGDTGDRGY